MEELSCRRKKLLFYQNSTKEDISVKEHIINFSWDRVSAASNDQISSSPFLQSKELPLPVDSKCMKNQDEEDAKCIKKKETIPHSKLKQMLSKASLEPEKEIVFESTKYVPDIYCGCEEKPYRLVISSGELDYSDAKVYLQKSGASESKSTAWHTLFIRREKPIQQNTTFENIHFLFPIKCSKLNALDHICLTNLQLCHKHVSDLFNRKPCVKELTLQNVIASEDEFCGCKGGEKLQVRSKVLQIRIRQDPQTAPNDSFEKPISESGLLNHIISASDLESFTVEGLPHSVDVRKAADLWMRAPTLRNLEISDINLTGTNGLMELPHTLEMNLLGVIIGKEEAESLKHQKRNADILYWQYEGGKLSAVVKLKLKITKAIFPAIFWPAYDYTCKQVSELCAHCRRLFTEHGLEENNEKVALEHRLNKNVLIYCISKTEDISALNKTIEGFPKRSKDFYNTIINKPETSKWLTRCDIAKEVLANDKGESLMVLLTDSRNRDALDKLLDSELSKDLMPRLFIIFYEMEKLSCQFKNPDKIQDKDIGVALQESTLAEVPNLIDNLCEKYVFAIVESKAKTLQEVYAKFYRQQKVGKEVCLEGLMNIPREERRRPESNRIEVKEALSRIKRMYQECDVDMPAFLLTLEDHIPSNSLKQLVFSVDRDNILFCGFRYGNVHIYVNGNASQEKKRTIIECVNTLVGMNFNIHYVSEKIVRLAASGTKVIAGYRSGTLAGYARYCEGGTSKLCGLTSKHVVEETEHPVIFMIGDEIRTTCKTPLNEFYDIAAIDIAPKDENKCDFKFFDENNQQKLCRVFRDESDSLTNKMVIFRGAITPLSRGKIVNVVDGPKSSKSMLFIEERENYKGQMFCEPGDSGSAVCVTDRKGDMFVVGMLNGMLEDYKDYSVASKTYVALVLKDGLAELKDIHNTSFELCSEEP